MTDNKQDPSVVAWQYRYWYSSGDPGVWLSERRDDADDLLESGVLIREETRALSLTSGLTAMKAELEEAKKATERMWCLSCGTVTRDGQCDCTRLDMDCQNLVNYADAMAGDREAAAKEINAILARAEAAEQERDELREALKPSAETKAAYMGEFAFNIEELDENGDPVARVVTVPWTTIKDIMAAIRDRAALSKPKPHDETRGRK
jgi:hypothetical protein